MPRRTAPCRRFTWSLIAILLVPMLVGGLPTLEAHHKPDHARGKGSPGQGDGSSQAPEIACFDGGSISQAVACVVDAMPRRGSEGYTAPTSVERLAFGDLAADMLAQPCPEVSLPAQLETSYTVTTFSDGTTGRAYCVAAETADGDGDGRVDRGWGTFIVDQAPQLEVHVQIPHPLYDTNTWLQGAELLELTGAASLLVAGTHRYANSAPAPSQQDHVISDVAHNEESPFQAATEALLDDAAQRSTPLRVVQFHAMGASTCDEVEVYMTHGLSEAPAEEALVRGLRAELVADNPGWLATVPGEAPACWLHGSTNVQGRLLNGVPADQVGNTWADKATERFLHIEQIWDMRKAEDWHGAIVRTFS